MSSPLSAAADARDDAAVRISIDGHALIVARGTSLAAALMGMDVAAFRRSVGGEPRAPLCGMGSCFECRVTVDGRPHVRACLQPVHEGMEVVTGE
jgi:D-hydroxyproline dehydrogenase subunit gamma